MRGICRLLGVVALTGSVGLALCAPQPATAHAATKQIALSEKQVQGFIAAQGKMAAAKAEAEMEAIAKAHGFSGMEEHDDVEANILLLLEAIDPHSRAFVEPPLQIKRRIEETKADTSLPERERKLALEYLADELKRAEPIRFPGNVELVRKYYDKLQAVLE